MHDHGYPVRGSFPSARKEPGAADEAPGTPLRSTSPQKADSLGGRAEPGWARLRNGKGSSMKKVVVTALAALAALAIIASASASIAPANQKLTFEGPAVHAWHDGADSPRDKDSRALFLHVEAGEYVAAYSAKSIHINKPAESVRGLSFAFQTSKHVGAGAPRISVKFGDGTYGFLSANYCNHPIVGSDWSRASFTGWGTIARSG